MSAQRICLHCGKTIPEHRQSGAKYCSDSCKARYHEKKLMKELFNGRQDRFHPLIKDASVKKSTSKAAVNLSEGLRGVIDASKTQPVSPQKIKTDLLQSPGTFALRHAPMPVKAEADNYTIAKEQIDKILAEIKRVNGMITAYGEQMQIIKNGKINLLPAGAIATGGVIGYKKTGKHLAGALSGAVAGWGAGALIDRLFFEEERKKQQKESLENLEQKRVRLQNNLSELHKLGRGWEDFICTLPQYTTKPEMRQNLLDLLKSNKIDNNTDRDAKIRTTGTKHEKSGESIFENTFPVKTIPVVQTNEKIISSKELKEMDYPCLNFKDEWKDLLGNPAAVFHLVVHGKPGEGKSTFCIQFADYLADNHGSALYISGEEGFSKTLQAKVIHTRADSPHLFFADLKSVDEIKAQIENKFNFIFIDSLNTLRIDSQKLKELKQMFPSSAFITICQSTKDGKMRGSQEIVHDADIAVYVEDKFAVTIKNRFKEKGMRFNVFTK